MRQILRQSATFCRGRGVAGMSYAKERRRNSTKYCHYNGVFFRGEGGALLFWRPAIWRSWSLGGISPAIKHGFASVILILFPVKLIWICMEATLLDYGIDFLAVPVCLRGTESRIIWVMDVVTRAVSTLCG